MAGKKAMGRPTKRTDQVIEEICERLADGKSLVQICSDPAMPGLRTVMRWASEDEAFGIKYAHAREAQAEVMDDMIMSAADEASVDPQAARVKIDAYKWRASKLAPKRYGDKLDLSSSDGTMTPAREPSYKLVE